MPNNDIDATVRMKKIVSRFQKYVETYSLQQSYCEYSDETFIDDMLYGIGIAIDPNKYKFSTGFDLWKGVLVSRLLKD